MRSATAIIGAGFGDEGKGLMTDYISHKNPNSLVVRFNGGGQAGHTVNTPENQRHVFGHIGSGAFKGCPTYLSEYFILNPIIFRKEYTKLSELISVPKIQCHPECLITTPYDMMINQHKEKKEKHGSCGMGINETIYRNQFPEFSLKYKDLTSTSKLTDKLESIKEEYVPFRLRQLEMTVTEAIWNIIEDEDILGHYISDFYFMYSKIICTDDSILKQYNHVIFEGAQGLLLDEESEFFPHVTRSRTGIHNVIKLLEKKEISLEVIYVTRAYLTRHGAGPFPQEDLNLNYIDETNKSNEFQGALRFGHLDLDQLGKAISKDLRICSRFNMAVTCLDQVNTVVFKHNKKLKEETLENFIKKVQHFLVVCPSKIYTSFGKTRDTVQIRTLH